MHTLAIVAAVLIVAMAVAVVALMAVYHLMMPDYAAGDERPPEP
jgi:hypothetical protein